MPVLAGLSVVVLLGAVGLALIWGDPLGGTPSVTVDIVSRPPAPADVPASLRAPPSAPAAATENGRDSASTVESASGVSVVRPDGTAAPTAVILRVPDAPTQALKVSPDPRLLERTRFGPLPKIGPDGSRPLDVYARPVEEPPPGTRVVARIAIVIGGLGISQTATADALSKLPAAVTFAFAPYGQDLDGFARSARAAGHEIMLQVPMEPFDYPDSDPGPHTLTTGAKPGENIEHLHWALGRLTGYVGLMNYMGGKLTSDPGAFSPILKEIGSRGLGFLDDGSSSRSTVASAAGATRTARAATVLDAVSRGDLIDKALEKLEATATSQGFAIGTASALPSTIERVARWSRGLQARGILLVPVSYGFRPTAVGAAGQ